MELSKQTLDLLKNFATINSNLMFKSGNKISTVAVAKDIYAEVEVPEVFPVNAGIYNMNEFLGVVSLFTKPDFDFDTNMMTIKEGKTKIKYVYADESLLTVPTKAIKMPSVEVKIELSDDQINRIQKAAAALSVGDLAIIGNGSKVVVKVLDVKNPTSNDYQVELEEGTSSIFTVYLKIEKLKLFGGGYTVEISSKKIAKFTHKMMPLSYYVSVESNSTFS